MKEICLKNLTHCSTPFKVIGPDMNWLATCHFLLTFHSNHRPIFTISEIISDFNQKKITEIFTPIHVYLMLQLREGSLWNWVTSDSLKKLEWWCYQDNKTARRYLQPFGYNTPTWQTDTGHPLVLRLCIASHGKNQKVTRINCNTGTW